MRVSKSIGKASYWNGRSFAKVCRNEDLLLYETGGLEGIRKVSALS